MACAMVSERAKFCFMVSGSLRVGVMTSSPSSCPKKTTSMPLSHIPARSRIGASGVPVHRALNTPPRKTGTPRLPEHSRVKSRSLRGMDLISSRLRLSLCLTAPVISRL